MDRRQNLTIERAEIMSKKMKKEHLQFLCDVLLFIVREKVGEVRRTMGEKDGGE